MLGNNRAGGEWGDLLWNFRKYCVLKVYEAFWGIWDRFSEAVSNCVVLSGSLEEFRTGAGNEIAGLSVRGREWGYFGGISRNFGWELPEWDFYWGCSNFGLRVGVGKTDWTFSWVLVPSFEIL